MSKPILADYSNPPSVQRDDTVYIIQHPKGDSKHFSQDTVKRVNEPYIEYHADTLDGSSGSPVHIFKESKFLLVALHSKGVRRSPTSTGWNKGVLVSEILKDFQEKGEICCFNVSTVAIYIQYIHCYVARIHTAYMLWKKRKTTSNLLLKRHRTTWCYRLRSIFCHHFVIIISVQFSIATC